MSDTSFGESFSGAVVPGAEGPTSLGGAPLNNPDGSLFKPVAPEVVAPEPVARVQPPDPGTLPPSPLGSFGSGFSAGFLPPSYNAPDPKLSALDQSADFLSQRVARANEVATSPLRQVFQPEEVERARAFIPQAAEMLQKIKQQKASMAAGRQQAESLGLAPGEVADEASQQDRVEAAVNGALKGDLNKFKGLQAVDPKRAEAIADQVYEVTAKHFDKAKLAFDSLSGMQNQGQYTAKLEQLRREGTLTDLEALGLKVPPSFDVFTAARPKEAAALRDAQIGINNVRQKLEERNTYQPMEEKEAKTYNGRFTTAYGDQITNGTWARNAASGVRGQIIAGAADPRDLGKKFVLATPEQRKAISEEASVAVPKAEIEKARAFDRTYELATKDAKGNAIGDGKINTNPNVQQGIAEGLASMLRGGSGGANVGLLNIETGKRGFMQAIFDKIVTEKAGVLNTLSEKDVRPYLTKLTQEQQRDVLDVLKAHNDSTIEDRIAPIARRAGALGLDPSAFGYGKDETAGVIGKAIEEGRQEQIARMLPNHQAVGGGDGVLQLNAQRPGAGATNAPQGAGPNTTQLPGAAPLATPVQQANGQPGSPSSGGAPPAGPTAKPTDATPTGPAGVAQPVTIAGQTVNVPPIPGASPQYLEKVQGVETPGHKSPWTATTGRGPDGKMLSSAGGAFQAIDSTWNANKPAGAPDKAKDATPQQQAEAAATLATKNAATLSKLKLPVNDTTLYMAHNVGAGGAASLLSADPGADARAIVGEAAARNNPTFFKGRPTVATVLDRYAQRMGDGAAETQAAGKPTEAPGIMTRVSRLLSQGIPGGDAGKDAAVQQLGDAAVEHAPAIGSTIGAVAGGVSPLPGGAIIGGGAGGAAGQAFKDRMQGREQSAARIVKEGALGAVLGVASEARPVAAAAARMVGASGVEAGAKAAEGGDGADIAEAGGTGLAYALGGEALGRFISAAGPAAHKLFSKFTPDAQAELSAQAGKLVEARKILATEQPKLAGEGAGPNPKYEVAKKTEEDAAQYIKDHGQKPDDMAYAYEQAAVGTSAGEAAVMRKANLEKKEASAGYDELRSDVRNAAPNEKNIKPNQAVPDGPVQQIRTLENPTGKVPEAFRADAEHAEMLVKAPAKDWGEKWQQLQDAGSELIKKRVAFLANADKPSAQAMDDIFKGVRNQQKAVAERLFGAKQGAEVISHLENLDKRYAKVMNATAGMDYQKMSSIIKSGNTAERRELEMNFKEFAKDDPSAIRAFNAMKAGAAGRMGEEAKLMIPVIAGEFAANAGGIPTVGAISAAIGGHRMYSLMKEYMNAKLLGKPVTFKDFFVRELKSSRAASEATAQTAQRGLVMQQ